MARPEDSPLLDMDARGIAAVLRQEAMLGGPDEMDEDADPVVHALWAGIKPYLFGCCGQLAIDLSRETDLPVVVLECRREGLDQNWGLRHAAVAAVDWNEAKAMEAAGNAFGIPVMDAVGAGDMDDRMEAFHLQGHEFRVVMAEDAKPDWMIALERREGPLLDHDPSTRMPGVADALGKPFDVREAVAAILSCADGRTLSRIPNVDGLRGWLAAAAPAP